MVFKTKIENKSKLLAVFVCLASFSCLSRAVACESLDKDLEQYNQSEKIKVVRAFRDPLNTGKILQYLPTFYQNSTGLITKPNELLTIDGIIIINVLQDELADGAKTNMVIPYVNGECRAAQQWWMPLDDETRDALIRAIE